MAVSDLLCDESGHRSILCNYKITHVFQSLGCHVCIFHSTMGMRIIHTIIFRQILQSVPWQGQKFLRQQKCIDIIIGKRYLHVFHDCVIDEIDIKIDIVTDNDGISDKIKKRWENILHDRCLIQHFIACPR